LIKKFLLFFGRIFLENFGYFSFLRIKKSGENFCLSPKGKKIEFLCNFSSFNKKNVGNFLFFPLKSFIFSFFCI